MSWAKRGALSSDVISLIPVASCRSGSPNRRLATSITTVATTRYRQQHPHCNERLRAR